MCTSLMKIICTYRMSTPHSEKDVQFVVIIKNPKLGQSVNCPLHALLPITHLLNFVFGNNCPFLLMESITSVPIDDPLKGHTNRITGSMFHRAHLDNCDVLYTNMINPWLAQSSPPWFSSLKSLIMSSIRRIVIAASVANCRRPSKPDFSTVLQSS
jgi:hypothetical protein